MMNDPRRGNQQQIMRMPAAVGSSTIVLASVLHVDDDANDTELLRAAARKAAVPFTLYNVEDADEAIAYLTGRGAYADRRLYPKPNLVLLDLKMPRKTGFELLHWIRQQPETNHVPVVVFSGSELKDDIKQAYDAGANSYLVKPLSFESLVEIVANLNSLWFAPLAGAGARLNIQPPWPS